MLVQAADRVGLVRELEEGIKEIKSI
jgi:hypothetical protein